MHVFYEAILVVLKYSINHIRTDLVQDFMHVIIRLNLCPPEYCIIIKFYFPT